MQSMSYLLAAQVVARGSTPSAVGRLLATNQRACFKAACKQLEDRAPLLTQLGLPASEGSSARGGWLRRLFGSE